MRRLWYLLLSLVFGAVLILFFFSLQKDPDLATEILAFATVLLAIATVLNIINSNEQEKRERKERLLTEIVGWATDVASSFQPAEITDFSDDTDAAKSWPFLAKRREKLGSLSLLAARSLAIGVIAEKINPRLKQVVENASNKLDNQQRDLWEFKQWQDTRPKKDKVDTEFLRQIAAKVVQNEVSFTFLPLRS